MKENLKNYLDKKPNAKVCILDNNSVEFLNKLKTKDISTVEIFKQYDVVLIPNWVLIEISDSRFRSDFIEELRDNGVNIYKIQEKEYIYLANGQELNILKIVLASVKMFQKINSYIHKNFIQGKNLEDIQYEYVEWIDKLYIDWPILGDFIKGSTRIQKKNAGEISITILANILSYYYPKLSCITLATFDKDCYDCVNCSHEELKRDINFKEKQYCKITFKSNDFIIFELVNSNFCNKKKIECNINIRCESRRIKYNYRAEDNSIREYYESINNNKFLELIDDPNIYIIY